MISQSVTNALMTAGVSSQTLTNIHVRAMNGRVILTGQVNSQTEKQRIETQVKQTPGVQTVINQLRIAGMTSPGAQNNTGVGGVGSSGNDLGTGTGTSGTSSTTGSPRDTGTGGTSPDSGSSSTDTNPK